MKQHKSKSNKLMACAMVAVVAVGLLVCTFMPHVPNSPEPASVAALQPVNPASEEASGEGQQTSASEASSIEDKFIATAPSGESVSLDDIDSATYNGFIIKRADSGLLGKLRYGMSLASGSIRDIGEGSYTAPSMDDASRFLSAADVEYVEPNYYLSIAGVYSAEADADADVSDKTGYDAQYDPSDPLFQGAESAGLYYKQTELRTIEMQQAWQQGGFGSQDVTVAVIDTGIGYKDLSSNAYPDMDYANVLAGKRFMQGNAKDGSDDVLDTKGHGTFCAAIIAAQGGNGVGGVGVSPNVKIKPYKVGEIGDDIQVSDLVRAIDDARNSGVDVINISLGGDELSLTEKSACDRARKAGLIVVAAAGNGGSSTKCYPAAFDSVFGVGSTNIRGDSKSSFSNYNSSVAQNAQNGADNVFVSAPGSNICFVDLGNHNKYKSDSGTSFSAPMVAGVAALAKSHDDALTPSMFSYLLKKTSKDIGNDGFDKDFGWGLVDAGALIHAMDGSITDLSAATVSLDCDVFVETLTQRVSIWPPGVVKDAVTQYPNVTVTLAGQELIGSTDGGETGDYYLELLSKDSAWAGLKKARVVGRNLYEGTVDFEYYIDPSSYDDENVKVVARDCTFTGDAAYDIDVSILGRPVEYLVDYNIMYKPAEHDLVSAGEQTVYITPISKQYSGYKEVSYTIKPAKMSEVTLEEGTTYYTGQPVDANLTLKLGKYALKKGEDYTLKCSNNVNAGTANYAITGTTNFTGSKVGQFIIKPAPLDCVEVAHVDAQAYAGGTPVNPKLTLAYNGRELVEGVDYSVEYSNSTGNHVIATANITGMGNFSGSKTVNYVIGTLSMDDVTVTGIPASYVFQGQAITPEPTLTYQGGAYVLKKDKDYTVEYSGNTNAGTAYVTITGINVPGASGFEGTIRQSFEIRKGSVAMPQSKTSFVYDGSAQSVFSSSAGCVVTGGSATDVGSYTALIRPDANHCWADNQGIEERSVEYVITPAQVKVPTAITRFPYNGKPHEAVVPGPLYEVSGGSAVNAGSYAAVISLKDKKNCVWAKSGTAEDVTVRYEIEPRAVSGKSIEVTLGASSKVYSGKPIKQKMSVKVADVTLDPREYEVTYQNNKKIGMATVGIALKGNYSGSTSATFKIVPKAVSPKKLKASRKALKFIWKKPASLHCKSITGYQIAYSKSKSFKGAKYVKVKKSLSSRIIKNLSGGKKYYVKIRAYKNVGGDAFYSAWSKAYSKTTLK